MKYVIQFKILGESFTGSKQYNEAEKAELESTAGFKVSQTIHEMKFIADADEYYCIDCKKYTEHKLVHNTELGKCSVCDKANWGPTGDLG